jgi:hypothetical protein
MTEEENPRNPKPGIFLLLGKRKRRASHIPTAPAAATLFQNLIPKGAFLRHSPNLSFRLILRLEKTAGVEFSHEAGVLADPEYDPVHHIRARNGGDFSTALASRRLQ